MNEKTPSIKPMIAGIVWLIISIILVLVWSRYSSEWWSPAVLLLTMFFFIAAIAHVFVYSVLPD
jgi:MFS-type transporter involved in bile tolerance (Atg22 family)